MSNYIPSVRVTKPTGGVTHHNVFSWDDGSSAPTPSKPSTIPRKNLETVAEVEDIHRRPGSETKQKELSGSGIFHSDSSPNQVTSNAYANNNDQNNGNFITDRPSVRVHHPAGGASQITFGSEEPVFKSKSSPLKVLELAGTSQTVEDVRSKKKSFVEAKNKELGSVPLFSPLPPSLDVPLPSPPPFATSKLDEEGVAGDRSNSSSVESASRRVSDMKIADLKGRGIYQDNLNTLNVSEAKKRELQGCFSFRDDRLLDAENGNGNDDAKAVASHTAASAAAAAENNTFTR